MPIIDGIDVHSLLQREGPMTPQRAVHVIEQLAAALDAAHAGGLVQATSALSSSGSQRTTTPESRP